MSEFFKNTNSYYGYGGSDSSLTNFFITSTIFCILSYISYYIIYIKEDVYDNNFTKGIVKNSRCIRDIDNKYNCSMTLSYNINNNEYDTYHLTNSYTYYSPGSLIDLRYNKYDYKNITTDTYSNSFKGGIVMFFGFFMLIISLTFLYHMFDPNN
jgi:hypothetical protein